MNKQMGEKRWFMVSCSCLEKIYDILSIFPNIDSPPMKPLLPHMYSDAWTFDKEMHQIFEKAPHYLGHEKSLPNTGDYRTLQDENQWRMLVHTENGIQLISNICRHRQAIMQQWSGTIKNITCPLHKWSWDISGKMQGAPFFDTNPCKNLQTWNIENWKWLLFEGEDTLTKKLNTIEGIDKIDFEEYIYHRTEHHECHYNWKTFMEVYGDDYHVVPYHPGLSNMVNLKGLKVTHGNGWHIQSVPSNMQSWTTITPIYKKWRDICMKQGNGTLPEYGAIWIAYYPNIMIEIYPYTITVSTITPISPEHTMNTVEFFYHKDAQEWLIETEEMAYMETVREDDILAELLDSGRKALSQRQGYENIPYDELSWPYHDPMEIGTKHFHEWYQDSMWI